MTSISSPSHHHRANRFVPTLACIAEEEPVLVAYRRITVPTSSDDVRDSNDDDVVMTIRIPIYNVNIYAPEPPKQPLSGSYQRLLAEMDSFIVAHKQAEKYRKMASNLRRKVAIEQAEKRRRASPVTYSDRDWYWYSQQTGQFRDEPVGGHNKIDNGEVIVIEKRSSEKIDDEQLAAIPEEEEDDHVDSGDVFDLTADF